MLFLFVLGGSFSSCKKSGDSETFQGNDASHVQTLGPTASMIMAMDSFVMSAVSFYGAISDLDSAAYCQLMLIINDENLSPEMKRNAISLESNLSNVFDLGLFLEEFIERNIDLKSNIINQDEEVLTYLARSITLEFTGFDVDRPNANPCAAYDAAFQSCSWDNAMCFFAALILGPPFGLVMAIGCGIGLIKCINAADAAYPGCKASFLPNQTFENWTVLNNQCP